MDEEMQRLRRQLVKMFVDKVETAASEHEIEIRKSWIKNIRHFSNVIHAASDDYSYTSDLVMRLARGKSISPKETTLLAIFLYLLAAEGIVCNFLNFVSYILVSAGHDLYSLTKRQYVKENFDEIRKVEMSTKIQFLNSHGFHALTKEYDSTFRNDIAHHNYRVDEDGALYVRERPVELDSKLDSLSRITRFAKESVREINETLDKLSAKSTEDQKDKSVMKFSPKKRTDFK